MFLLACITTLIVSCSSKEEDYYQTKADIHISQEVKTSFDATSFSENLKNVSRLFATKRRSSELNEELAMSAIKPFVEDGKFVQQQLLDDNTITIEEKKQIKDLGNEDLAVLSVIAYAVITANDSNEPPMLVEDEYMRKENIKLHCIGEALGGGAAFSGGLTLGVIKAVGTKTAIRMATTALGGMIGGAITAAFLINDYNICMNRH